MSMYDIDDRESDASSSSHCVFPTSSARDEPFQPTASTTRYDLLHRLLPSPPRHTYLEEYRHYLPTPSYTIAPGLTSQGKLTTSHPFVFRLLSRLPSVTPTRGRQEIEKWWTKTFKQWEVNDVLDLTDDEGNKIVLSDLQSECVFTLAALKVLHHPTHPKHFTMWGKDWAQKTAERVQKVLQLNPCPIAYCSSWMSIEQSLWFVDAEQASAFPSKKEGKKANNGMLLRKRKAGAAAHVTFDPLAGVVVEGVTDSGRPKKRVRTSPRERKGKTSDAAQIHEANGEMLEELSLPGVVVSLDRPSSSSSSTAFSPSSIHSGTPTKETKLELMGVDAPLAPSITASPTSASVAQLSAPEPKRRSVRQAHKRGDTSTPSSAALNMDLSLLTPTSDITSLTNTPSVQDSALPAGQEQDGSRPVITRARSSSSSCASAVTVVSNASSATTVVDEEASEKSKEVDKEVGMEKEGKLRTSGRARKSAAKKVEAEVAEKVGSAPRKGRARQRTVGRK